MRRAKPDYSCHSERSEESQSKASMLRFFVSLHSTQNDMWWQLNQRRVGFAPPFFVAIVFCVAAFALVTLSGGCSYLPGTGAKEQKPTFEQIVSVPYEKTIIGESINSEVLEDFQRSPEVFGPHFKGSELISRSENVIAAIGQTEDGYRNWFNMVAFDEYRPSAARKYFFFVDDRPAKLIRMAKCGLRFDCRMILADEVLNGTYESESAKQVAFLKNIIGSLRGDINELVANTEAPGQSNKALDVNGMLMNQVFEMIFLKIDSAPILATNLSRPDGVEFDHITFNKGRVYMAVYEGVAQIKIRFGTFADDM